MVNVSNLILFRIGYVVRIRCTRVVCTLRATTTQFVYCIGVVTFLILIYFMKDNTNQ